MKDIVSNSKLFISGQIGTDPVSGKIISTNIVDETKQLMENIKSILDASNIRFSHVLKSSIYITNINDLDAVNKVYASYFEGNFPACEVLEIIGLRLNANVEISMIASME